MLRLRRRVRGIKLGRKLVRVFKWAFSRRRTTTRYHQLSARSSSSCYNQDRDFSFTNNQSNSRSKNKTISKLRKWGRSISQGAKEICSPRSRDGTSTTSPNSFLQSNYIRVTHNDYDTDVFSPSATSGNWRRSSRKRIGSVPKGHLAVYVGEEEKERVLVPVIYLNHPLFEKLLKEAEQVYGFDQPGRITIPCPISEFEHVQTEIAERDYSRRWRKQHQLHSSGLRCLTI